MDTLHIYRSGTEFRWKQVSPNGQNRLNPGETYKKRATMLRTIATALRVDPDNVKAAANKSRFDEGRPVPCPGYDEMGRYTDVYKIVDAT